MNLFERDKENKPETKAEPLLPEEQAPEAAESKELPAAEKSAFVLAIEGEEVQTLKETEEVKELRGATKTLPNQKQIEAAIEAAEEAVEETAEAAEEAVEKTAEAAEEAVEETSEAFEATAEPTAAEETVEAIQETVKETVAAAEEAAASEAGQSAENLASVSYASVAQAMVNVKKEPTGRFDRDAVDDETLLAELYALIGDGTAKKPAATAAKENAAPVQTRPAPRPAVRITPETLQDAPEEFVEIEEDTAGVPGWLKGVFILLISLLLSAMTFYAVASDVIGKIF